MNNWLRIVLAIVLALTICCGCTGTGGELPEKPANSDKFAQESIKEESVTESSQPEESSKPEESSTESSRPEESSTESSQPEESSEPAPTPNYTDGKFNEIQWHTGIAMSDPYILGGDEDPLTYQGGMIGEFLFNNDGLKIWVNSCYSDSAGYHWQIGYENGRPESFLVQTSDFTLNGIAINSWWSLMIMPESDGFSEMTWTLNDILTTGLHEITIGEFLLTIEAVDAGFNLVENEAWSIQTGTGIPYYYSYMPVEGSPYTIIYDDEGMTILATWYDGYEGVIIQELVMLNGSDVGQSMDINQMAFNDQWIDYLNYFYVPAHSTRIARIYYYAEDLDKLDLTADYFIVKLDVTIYAPSGDRNETLFISYN
ncbi:MAG: hypothetical protein J5589_04865 [Firmicutes bacterium]|nr:hypothetical protein [Bacillota bacterium]